MSLQATIVTILVATAAAIGTFAATRAARAPRDLRSTSPTTAPATTTASDPTQVLMNWLAITPGMRTKISAQDPSFPADLQKLREALAARRSALADALQDPRSTSELISARVEDVIAASNSLERRITRYLLAVRPGLSPDQQRKLFGLCAEGVRQGSGWCWRRGAGGPADAPGQGRGMGAGAGSGRGGPRYRGGR